MYTHNFYHLLYYFAFYIFFHDKQRYFSDNLHFLLSILVNFLSAPGFAKGDNVGERGDEKERKEGRNAVNRADCGGENVSRGRGGGNQAGEGVEKGGTHRAVAQP